MANDESMSDPSCHQESHSFPMSPSDSGGSIGELDMELFPDLVELERSVASAAQACTKPSECTSGVVNKETIAAMQDKELMDYLTGKGENSAQVSGNHTINMVNENITKAQNQTETRGTTTLKLVKTAAGGPPVLVKLTTLNLPTSTLLATGNDSDSFASGNANGDVPCMSKNAVAARENRKRKKQYVVTLEKQTRQLQTENSGLKEQVAGLKETVGNLESEVAYLKEVLANQSTLSALIGNIQSTAGLEFTTSLQTQFQFPQNEPKKDAPTCTKNETSVTVQVAHSVEGGRPATRGIKRLCASAESEGTEDHCVKESIPKSVCTRARGKQHKSDMQLQQDHSYCDSATSACPVQASSTTGAGVCLHVSNRTVSLEFCATCSNSASKGKKKGQKF